VKMWTIIGRILSLLIAVGYTIAAVTSGGVRGLIVGAWLIFPLVLIWFPEELGDATGFFGRGYITSPSPPILVSFFGWFFLVGMPVILYFLWR
jgi:hypothetical protein